MRSIESVPLGSAGGEEELDLEADRPVSDLVGLLDVVVRLELQVHRQLADPQDLAHATADRNGPSLFAGAIPVCSHDRLGGEVPAIGQVVVHERLHQKLIHAIPAGGAGVGPDVLNKASDHPGAGVGESDETGAG